MACKKETNPNREAEMSEKQDKICNTHEILIATSRLQIEIAADKAAIRELVGVLKKVNETFLAVDEAIAKHKET